ncbi:isomerase, partial [Salmonella enterica subsp. enterica serovar Virchow]|nr:isomerase [Salmonella enterica subsp. enterica serovar Virchow]
QAFLANLRYASDIGRDRGVDILIEPLNPHDVPGYYLTDPREAAALIDDCKRGNVRILFDCYHLARNGLDIRQTFEDLRPYVGHIQFAGVPDRAEPDHGAVDYQRLLPSLARMGYAGWFGAEYRPRGRTDDGLKWLGPLGRAIAAER